VRFANTVDVRRAYEACVLHAPGARWVPEAMLTIGALREDEGKYSEAAKVYENLRNIHPKSDEAKSALMREAEVRMVLLRDHAYNRSRCRDTVDFLRMAVSGCRPSNADRLRELQAEAQGMIAEEEWRATRFYDSPTRTRRSAVSAYEKFIAENPGSPHAEEAKARLAELKGGAK
jgi:outer membrane protein assembly factor BamD (BamD/ComL family)